MEPRELDQAVEHCTRHIERNRAELEKRESAGRDTTQVRNRLRTLETLRATHEAERRRLRSEHG